MTAAEALEAALAVGVELRLDGEDLVLEAPTPPPATIIDMLTRHRPCIVLLLRPGRDGRSADDWRSFFHERAAVAEFDGAVPRPEAAARTFACCVVGWLNRNFVGLPPGRCLACGAGECAHDPLLPFGIEQTGHAWLHSRCWPAWHEGRTAEAIAALAKLGVTPSGVNQ